MFPLTPTLSLKGEGGLRAGIIYGEPSARRERKISFRNSCAFASRFLILTLITIILTTCFERSPHE
ncbi:hypothetical protein EGK68_12415 [Enterobacter cloacae]|uniref:Uncharacterized protein n=1 Tax=Enterobacter cloacae TaxID=550 RepID=A0A3R9B3H9_ENTCL|nr:hypothetical protein EGK68_12415 [Enterobacter cloacae]